MAHSTRSLPGAWEGRRRRRTDRRSAAGASTESSGCLCHRRDMNASPVPDELTAVLLAVHALEDVVEGDERTTRQNEIISMIDPTLARVL